MVLLIVVSPRSETILAKIEVAMAGPKAPGKLGGDMVIGFQSSGDNSSVGTAAITAEKVAGSHVQKNKMACGQVRLMPVQV